MSEPTTRPAENGTEELDTDAQAQVIASLRAQVGDLFTQVGQLNNKLVTSYDRISDLEDSLHARSESLKTTAGRVIALEAERSQHLSDLSAGLLVERTQVTAELTRLMDRATDEAARRGQAESARTAIETELGELSTNLFEQANRMVKEANVTRDQAERRAADAEDALRTAEEAVGGMQIQMQLIRSERDRLDNEFKSLVDKGKWVDRDSDVAVKVAVPKLISSHLPYEEFLLFVAHLRSLRPQAVPAMSSLLPLPFITRLVTEDSDPTLRLDLAPALNWLSRRAVATAVHAGALDITPVSTGAYLHETSNASMAAPSSISCALCGKGVHSPEALEAAASAPQPPPVQPPPLHRSSSSVSGGWGGVFKQNGAGAPASSARPAAPSRHDSNTSVSVRHQHPIYQTQLYVFRVSTNTGSTTYALCNSGWCLPRLRAACALWHFVRTGVVERLWEEEMPSVPTLSRTASNSSLRSSASAAPPIRKHSASASLSLVNHIGNIVRGNNSSAESSPSAGPPPVPPRKGSGVGSLFGMLGSNRSPVVQPASAALPLTPTREKPSMSRTPPGSTTRSPTLGSGTVARRRPSNAQSPNNVRSASVSGVTAPSSESKTLSATKPLGHGAQSSVDLRSILSPIENGIDETGPPAEVMFDFDDPLKSPPVSAAETMSKQQEAPLKNKPTSPRTRPMSASGVPLPMSPPTTPEPMTPPLPDVTKANGIDGHTPKNSISGVPSGIATPALDRTASPALDRAASPVTNGRTPPAAPPVPKRAAGRRRAPTILRPDGVSPAITPRAQTPVAEKDAPITEKIEEDVAVANTEESKSTDATPASEAEQTTTADPTATKQSAETNDALPTTIAEEPEPSMDSELIPEQPTITAEALIRRSPSPEPLAASTPAPTAPKMASAPAGPFKHLSLHKNSLTVDSTFVTLDSPLFSALPVSPAFEPPPVPPKPVVSPADSGNPKAAWEQYVGEATWEERTWKEIVRLREEMFWARIGCMR
ncbi:hypothetical protein BKA62DRAFT_657398 [Auriculariales sp. MPI-PUGE-AT-0066]|nr:hypothetical protein BKA62DRAFT_657398 [Auriculariales sp. MPI-PUGE-AT-0066]